MNGPRLPRVEADLMLVHAPAFFDFRERSDIYFPYLSTSGDVPITPLYEYFPLGFKTLQRFLGEREHDVKIINLSSVLLRYPGVDVEALLGAIEARVFGIDLHWMVHVQGALEVARLIKAIHPDARVLFGGISSTYFAAQLIRYPFIDMVMRGYDTHRPMEALLRALRSGGDLHRVENLLWTDAAGEIVDNGFSHTPDSFSCGIDWSTLPRERDPEGLPILEVLSTQNAGCAYNCGWCGGSREAFRRINGRQRAMARKPPEEIDREFASMRAVPDLSDYYFYSVGSYNESKDGMRRFIERVGDTDFRAVSYEQFHLTPLDVVDMMVKANKRTTITLSPESHDPRVARLAGRGVYSMDEMEDWIAAALDRGIHEIDVWFFIGMPEQDERSVAETVDYCGELLQRFRGKSVVPLLCPMIPFLDPASTFFEEPDAHGYRIFHRTVEEHRRGMERASLIHRINYETRWLRREQLVRVGYQAVRRLTELKVEAGALANGIARSVIRQIDDAVEFIGAVHEVDCIADEGARRRELAALGPEILRRNRRIFAGGVANQAFPVNRDIGGRWFDETLWSHSTLEAAQAAASPR